MASKRSLGTLTLDLIADTSKFTPGMNKAGRSVDKNMRSIERSVRNATRSLATFASVAVFRSLTQGVQQYSDEYISLNNRLKVATAGHEQFAIAQKLVYEVAQDTRAQLGATAELYQRIALATTALGLSQKEMGDIVTTVNKSLVISGSTTQGAHAAIIQLGQGLAAGALRGQEFNSVAEQAPRLLTVLADALDKTTGELRDMANVGELTSEVVVKALQTQSKQIAKEFELTSVTIGQANTRVRNSLVLMVGEQLEASGSSQQLVGALDDLRVLLEDPATAQGLGLIASGLISISTAAIQAIALVGEFADTLGRTMAQVTGNLAIADEIEAEIKQIDRVIEGSYFSALVLGTGKQNFSLFTKTKEELNSLRYSLQTSISSLADGSITKPIQELESEVDSIIEKLNSGLEAGGKRVIFGVGGVEYYDDAELRSSLKDLYGQIGQYNKANAIVLTIDTKALEEEFTVLSGLTGKLEIPFNEDAQKLVANLREQVELFGLAADAVARYNIKAKGGNAQQQAEGAALATKLEYLEREKDAREKATKALEQSVESAKEFVSSLKEEVRLLQVRAQFGEDNVRANYQYEASLLNLNDAQKANSQNLITEIELLSERQRAVEKQKEVDTAATGVAESLRTETEAIRAKYDEEKKILEDSTNFTLAEKARLQESLKKQRDDEVNDRDSFDTLVETLKKEEQVIQESYQSRRELILANTLVGSDAQTALLVKIEADRQEQLIELQKATNEKMNEYTLEAARNIQDALGSGLYDILQGDFDNIGMSFVKMLQKMVSEALAASLALELFGNFGETGAIGGLAGKVISSFDGGGYTGSGARSGGVDGKGGFMAVLHPQETVTDHTKGMAHSGLDKVPTTGSYLLEKGERVTTEKTSAKLDRTLDQVSRSGNNSNESSSVLPSITNINVLDPAIVGDYLGTTAGEKVIMNVIQRNRAALRF